MIKNKQTVYAIYKQGQGFYSKKTKLYGKVLTPSRIFRTLKLALETKEKLQDVKIVHIDLIIRSNLW